MMRWLLIVTLAVAGTTAAAIAQVAQTVDAVVCDVTAEPNYDLTTFRPDNSMESLKNFAKLQRPKVPMY